MKTLKLTPKVLLLLMTTTFFIACSDDDDGGMNPDPTMKETTIMYDFNNGQAVPDAPYQGMHSGDLMAEMKIKEMENNETQITVTLMNTIEGETYMVHAHDAADPNETPNGTPYNETPNSDVFVQMIEGNGDDASKSQTVSMSFEEITEMYEGFFVVHDPLQDLTTVDISTYLIVGGFAREQEETNFMSASFDYDFNMGQVDENYAYEGEHPTDFSATLMLQELAGNKTRVSVMLHNTISGEQYMVHAHDFANPEETPNGTPYNETPNSDVLVLMLMGGNHAIDSQISSMSFNELTTSYEAFFVVHDPLQELTTVDPTTYIALGVFAN